MPLSGLARPVTSARWKLVLNHGVGFNNFKASLDSNSRISGHFDGYHRHHLLYTSYGGISSNDNVLS